MSMMIKVYFVENNEDKLRNICYVSNDTTWVIEVNSDWMIWSNYMSCFNNLIYDLQANFTAHIVHQRTVKDEWIDPDITDQSAVSIAVSITVCGIPSKPNAKTTNHLSARYTGEVTFYVWRFYVSRSHAKLDSHNYIGLLVQYSFWQLVF